MFSDWVFSDTTAERTVLPAHTLTFWICIGLSPDPNAIFLVKCFILSCRSLLKASNYRYQDKPQAQPSARAAKLIKNTQISYCVPLHFTLPDQRDPNHCGTDRSMCIWIRNTWMSALTLRTQIFSLMRVWISFFTFGVTLILCQCPGVISLISVPMYR